LRRGFYRVLRNGGNLSVFQPTSALLLSRAAHRLQPCGPLRWRAATASSNLRP